MKTIATTGLMLCLALAPSIARAELSADDRAFATALEAQLRSLDAQKQACVRGVTLSCERTIENTRSTIQAILADPDRLHYESERLRIELRQELLSLLMDVRAASAVLNAQSSYEEFTVRMGPIGNRLALIRYRYHIALSRGDNRALGVPVSDACTALYAAAADWKQLRRSAREIASAQAAVSQAPPWQADYFQRQLREAQLKQAQAQRRLADNTTAVVTLVHNATRAARYGESTNGQAAVRK
jgi:hypothetical protein